MEISLIVLALCALFVCALVATNIGHVRQQSRNFWLGLVFGLVGLVVVAVLKVTDDDE